jgi:hypothetical protein
VLDVEGPAPHRAADGAGRHPLRCFGTMRKRIRAKCAADSWRIAETRDRRQSDHGREISGSPTPAAVANLAHLPTESGERNPETLAALSHPGIHATRQTIARSLEGTWQPDLLFELQQEVAMYDSYQTRIEECDASSNGTYSTSPPRSPRPMASRPRDTARETAGRAQASAEGGRPRAAI